MQGGGIHRDAVEEGVDARACSCQPGLERIAFLSKFDDLLLQEVVRLLQRMMAREQLLDTVGNLIEKRGCVRRCHGGEEAACACRRRLKERASECLSL